MLSKIFSSATYGIDAYLVEVETNVESHIPGFTIVGLPDNAVKESRERVTAAIKNSGLKFPTKKITVNLAPADIKKEFNPFELTEFSANDYEIRKTIPYNDIKNDDVAIVELSAKYANYLRLKR